MKYFSLLIVLTLSSLAQAKMSAEEMSQFFRGVDTLSEGIQLRSGTKLENPSQSGRELADKLQPCQTVSDESPEGPANYYEISGPQCPLKFTSLASYMSTEDGSIMTDTKEFVELFSKETDVQNPIQKLDLKKRWRFMLNDNLQIDYQERFVKGTATLWTGEEIEYKTSYKENKPADSADIVFSYEVTIQGDEMSHHVLIDHKTDSEVCSLDEQNIPCEEAWKLVARSQH